MSLNNVKHGLMAILPLFLLISAHEVKAEYGLNMTKGITPISHIVYDLHMLILWICVVIGIVVFGAMFWSILHHRKAKGAVAAQFHHNITIEIIWTAIPALILVAMAYPATKTLIAMEQTGDADVLIKVTGHQWKWQYDYIDEDIRFFSSISKSSNEAAPLDSGIDPWDVPHYLRDVDKPVVVPVNRKIRFLITANDVIHSWWVPELGFKKDAIPGFINESWALVEEPGTYRGQCAELCGKGHAYMPIVLVAKEESEYKQWVGKMKAAQAAESAGAEKTWSKADLMAKSKAVYGTNCVACHQANGEGIPGVFPALKGSLIATGPIKEHLNIVLNGKAGTAMAAFGAQLSDVDLAAVITYERNAWGNDTGDVVQPSEVKAAR